MAEESQAVQIEHAYLTPTRFPIKAARLLVSAPDWVLIGPVPIIAFILLASLAYTFWAVRDELVIAPLQLEREQVTMESVGPGIVTKVMVSEGDRMESQSVLMEVQQTRATYLSDRETLTRNREDLRKQEIQENDEYEYKKRQLQLTASQLVGSIKNLDKDRINLQSQLGTAQQNVTFREGKLKDARKQLEIEQKLYQQKDITKVDLDRYKGTVDDLEKAVFDAKEEVKRLQATLEALSEDRIRADIKKNDNEINQLNDRHQTTVQRVKDKIEETERQLKAEAGLIQGVANEGLMTIYRSNFSGIIAQVHVKQGQLINPGINLVTIVKESAALVGRVLVQNKDIGRLTMGQRVMIKYFAYPYQEYGIPEGIIADISSKPGGVPGKESMYLVQVAGIQETINKIGGKPKPLEIGVEGLAEIKVGEKRFIELLFSPISRFFTQAEF